MRPLAASPLLAASLLALSVSACGSSTSDATPATTAAAGGAAASGGAGGATTSSSGGAGGASTSASGGAGGAPTTSASGGAGGAGGAGGSGGSGGDPAEVLFAEATLPTFSLTLSDAAKQSLAAAPKTYVKGDLTVTIGGQTIALPEVGVRLKGNYGSFRTLDQKAAFLVNVDKYQKKQSLFGLTKLALNNMVQDPSLVHERLGYELFRAAGVPASRAAHAKVEVNGEPYGLYLAVETTDRKDFLDHWFGEHAGNLYEGAYGVDLVTEDVSLYDLDAGPDIGFSDVQALVTAIDGMTTPATFLADASKVVDMDEYLHFAATEIFLGHWDGYAWTKNNYFIYRGGADGRWRFVPWGIDQTFGEHLGLFGGDGRLERLCVASEPCLVALAKAFEDVAKAAEGLALEKEAASIHALVEAAAVADPRREYDVATMDGAYQGTLDFIASRPGDVAAGVVCTQQGKIDVDGDGDGYSSCGADCDDSNPNRHPGAPEICGNFVDDDCNGVIDDGPNCPPCIAHAGPGGEPLAFCLTQRTWADAEADCVAQGGHLVSIHGQPLQDDVAQTALAIAGDVFWLGGNDQAVEGTFAWTDGTPLDFTSWNGGEPNNYGGNENCMQLAPWTGGLWNDLDCATPGRYVCRLK
jgi:hypothetical protein